MKVRMSQFRQTRRSLIVRVSIVVFLVAFVVTLCSFLSLILGSIEIFQVLFQKLGLAVGGQALACALCKLGLPSGLSLAIGRFARVLITGEQVSEMVSPLFMRPTGSDSGNSSPGWTSLLGSTGQQPSVVPSGGSLSGGWTRFDEDVLLEAGASSSGHSNSNPSINQPRPGEQAMPPANPVASAGPSHVLPFPYDEEEVIGGDSVLSIQNRLLSKEDSPSAEQIEWARLDAQDRFELKVEVIEGMAALDPTGDWLNRGARALDNPRASSGEPSLEELSRMRDDLNVNGWHSATFHKLKEKVFLRKENGDDESQA